MAAIKSNDSLLSFEMKLIAKGKTNACFVTPQSLFWRLHRLEYSEARSYNV